jgi:hypothetical protein
MSLEVTLTFDAVSAVINFGKGLYLACTSFVALFCCFLWGILNAPMLSMMAVTAYLASVLSLEDTDRRDL